MKCHYEVLGVSRDAEDSEIKTAYRKLALRWHPDKNLDDPEEAKEQFQLVQQAYEVLSDLHERAWYDNHREQILRGKNTDYQENCLDVFQYFTASCFKGYGDDARGFYQVYSEVFNKIATEDAEFMDDEEEIADIPQFGNSTSSYEDVVGPFYAYWQSYCTKKSYTWLCPYNINEIKDRRILREIEKDLKKIVQKKKKERNEEVRALVSFVRKRDKRVQAYKKLLEERAALNRQKQEQNRLEQIRKRQKEMEELKNNSSAMLNQDFEEQLRQLEQEYGGSEIEDMSTSEEIDDDELIEEVENLEIDESLLDLYCVACNREFKNENAFLNHESSKKHKENVDKLKKVLQEEEEIYKASEPKEHMDHSLESEDELLSDTENKPNKQKNKKSKKNKKILPQAADSDLEETISDLLPQLSEEETDWNDSARKGNKKQKQKVTQKKVNPQLSVQKTKSDENNISGKSEKVEKSVINSTDINHTCVTCKATFESKNKLFAHLKKTDHGIYIPKKISGNSAAATGQKTITNGAARKGKRTK